MNDAEHSLAVGGEQPPLLDLGPIEQVPEMNLLVGDRMSMTPEAAVQGESDPYLEWKRTRTSVVCADLTYESNHPGNYEQFAGRQKAKVRLKPEEFQEFGQFTRDGVGNQSNFIVLKYVLITHDAFKNDDMFTRAGIDRNEYDHDQAIAKFFGEAQYEPLRREYFPTFYKLNSEQQELYLAVMCSELNYAQEYQGETPPATLAFLNEPGVNRRALQMKILEGKFDIAGALGYRYEDGSLTLDSPTYRHQKCLDTVLLDETYTNPVDRSDGYWSARAVLYGVRNISTLGKEEREVILAFTRMAGQRRLYYEEEFNELRDSFRALGLTDPRLIEQVVVTGLRRTGIKDRALLPGYLPAVLRSLQEKHGKEFVIRYAAMLHEAAMAMRSRGPRAGVVAADLGAIAAASARGDMPEHASIGFRHTGNRLVAHIQEPPFGDLENLPFFMGGEQFRGKRVLLLNMSGGSGAIEAAVMGELLATKFGSTTAGIASIRQGDRPLQDARLAGQASWVITPKTTARGDWRFAEKLVVERGGPPVFMINPTGGHVDSQELLTRDLIRIITDTRAEMVIGVDPGGDSLYVPDARGDDRPAAHLNYKQDHAAILALADIEQAMPSLQAMTLIPAPGMYGPNDAREALESGHAARLRLSDQDTGLICSVHERLGLGTAFHSAAASTLQYALQGEFGLRTVQGRPIDKVLADDPWQTFNMIVPVMRNVVILRAADHYRLIHDPSRRSA